MIESKLRAERIRSRVKRWSRTPELTVVTQSDFARDYALVFLD